jgi:hypothetical protein
MTVIEPAERPAWLPAAAAKACDALEAAGIRVAFDVRSVSPPIVLALPITRTPQTECLDAVAVQFVGLPSGGKNADAIGWLWNEVAPVLCQHCDVEATVYDGGFIGIEGEIEGTVPAAYPQPTQEES